MKAIMEYLNKKPCWLLQKNGSRVLYVSKNQGHAWNAAQLPMIGKEQFYSFLDLSEDMVFLHVDQPGGEIVGLISLFF